MNKFGNPLLIKFYPPINEAVLYSFYQIYCDMGLVNFLTLEDTYFTLL